MPQIYDVGIGDALPKLSSIKGTLDIPEMTFDSIEDALQSYAKAEREETDKAEENFNKLTELYDENLNEKFDNMTQKEIFQKAKDEVGLSEQDFKIGANDLRDDYKVRGLRSKAAALYNRADVKELLLEQEIGKSYLQDIRKYKDMNPELYKMALKKYNDYRNDVVGKDGKPITGFDLLPQEFMPIDIDKTIVDALSLIPEIKNSQMKFENGIAYVVDSTGRSKELAKIVTERLEQNPVFMNNIKAKYGDIENDPKARAAYDAEMNALVGQWTTPSTDISKVTKMTTGKSGTGATGDPLVDGLREQLTSMGGNVEGEDYKLLEAAKKGAHTFVDEGDRITFKVGYGTNERSDFVLKGANSKGQVYYDLTVNGKTFKLTNQDIKDWVSINPEVKTAGKNETNEGHWLGRQGRDKTIVRVVDGKLETNNVKFLIDKGIVPDGTLFKDLSKEHKFGIRKGTTEDGEETWIASKTIDDLGSVPYSKPPNQKQIDRLLSSNPVISQYPKNSEKYRYASLFLANPEIQDGFFRDVYMKQDYVNYLDSLKTVAPLVDGKFDISNVHDSLKPFLKTNKEIKLKYLAHHHGNSSKDFLANGESSIAGNNAADSEVKSVWKNIDQIIAANPSWNFEQVRSYIESKNNPYAVYNGNANSSAIGKNGVLFETHYPKIKKYIDENQHLLNTSKPKGGTPAPAGDNKLDDLMNYLD